MATKLAIDNDKFDSVTTSCGTLCSVTYTTERAQVDDHILGAVDWIPQHVQHVGRWV